MLQFYASFFFSLFVLELWSINVPSINMILIKFSQLQSYTLLRINMMLLFAEELPKLRQYKLLHIKKVCQHTQEKKTFFFLYLRWMSISTYIILNRKNCVPSAKYNQNSIFDLHRKFFYKKKFAFFKKLTKMFMIIIRI